MSCLMLFRMSTQHMNRRWLRGCEVPLCGLRCCLPNRFVFATQYMRCFVLALSNTDACDLVQKQVNSAAQTKKNISLYTQAASISPGAPPETIAIATHWHALCTRLQVATCREQEAHHNLQPGTDLDDSMRRNVESCCMQKGSTI